MKSGGDFVGVERVKDFGWVWENAFKTITCGKVGIRLPCGIEGISHGEACTWFEGARNFAMRLACNEKQHAPFDNDGILL
jgi:hypothetical protein